MDRGYELLRCPRCPHCGEDFHVWDDDRPMSLNYEDGGHTEFRCDECEKDFICVTSINYVFSTAIDEEAADDDHWGPQRPADRPTGSL